MGFKHFHPMPITQNGSKLCGQGEMGGAWEWTSSVLEKHDGFEPMDLYPAYTGLFLSLEYRRHEPWLTINSGLLRSQA